MSIASTIIDGGSSGPLRVGGGPGAIRDGVIVLDPSDLLLLTYRHALLLVLPIRVLILMALILTRGV